MKRRGVTGASHMAWWTAAAGIIVFVGLSVGSMMLVSKPVSASYEKAMSFANSFCKDYPRGVADTAWITAPDGGRVINADKGARTVKVKVHIAGKYCPTYSANLAGSSYFDTKNPNASEPKPNGRITGNMDYNNNGGGNTFYVTELKDFDVKDLSKAAGRVEYPVHMALSLIHI